MLYYGAVAISLLALALAGCLRERLAASAGLASAAVLVLFAGLRFETGFDWPEYLRFYEATPTIGELLNGAVFPSFSDPLYVAMTSLVKTAGGSFEALLFLVALLAIGLVQIAAGRITKNTAVMWMFYFGVVFTMAQMTLLRQAIASGFVLLALIWAVERRSVRGWIAGVVALGFHISAAAFLPLVVLWRVRPAAWFCAAVVVLGIAVAATQTNLVAMVGGAVMPFAPSSIAYRVAYYAALAPAPITPGSAALIGFHLAVLGAMYWRDPARALKADDPYVRMAIWLTLAVLAAHLYLWSFPNVWNRVMMVAIPWQVSTLWRIWPTLRAPRIHAAAALVAMSAFSTAALLYFLAKPGALPFVPYQNVIAVALTGDCGDGAERLRIAEASNDEFTTPQVALPAELVALEEERVSQVSASDAGAETAQMPSIGDEIVHSCF